jgi:amino acid transporter
MPVNERGGTLPIALFAGFAVSSVGGPLALAALYLPDAVGGPAISSMGLVALAGAALFAAPLLIWWRYSGQIASDGGLYAFVERAAGRRVALVQGCIWTLSYFLYLPFTVTYLVYNQLPESFPGIVPHQKLLELLLPIAIAGAILAVERLVFVLVAVIAVVQVVLTLVFAWVLVKHAGVHPGAFRLHANGPSVARGIGNVALLFTCASLPLFLGGEVSGGGRTVRRTILAAVVITAALILVVAVPMAALGDSQLAALEAPGYTLVKAYEGDGLATVIAYGAAASVVAVIVAEFVALTRLMHVMLGVSIARAGRVIAVLLVAVDAISLIDPERFYSYALTPSLVALYVSQAIVFLVYPLFRGKPSKLEWIAVATATGLAGFGLEVVISQQPYS